MCSVPEEPTWSVFALHVTRTNEMACIKQEDMPGIILTYPLKVIGVLICHRVECHMAHCYAIQCVDMRQPQIEI